MRVYVDGVLEGVCYGKDKMHPRGKAVALVLPENGTIDEIRFSRVDNHAVSNYCVRNPLFRRQT